MLDDVSQHSKNTQGFNAIESFMTKEMPRSVSICQFVLAAPKEQMIIEDLKKDTRTQNFHKMPMAPNIQFYAGTPSLQSGVIPLEHYVFLTKNQGPLFIVRRKACVCYRIR